ncbi:hypothetical protein FRACYDRAFT_260579 [Fragilariopsis cylindrus CCMP1102]|uniref:Smr domain-containing protein n=1 Tax=Fragilariopsis cylindrus CCMP1102 TaxID=635003 RepID=A0A1E7FL40_9STRA|nr:hypothetical protein FRACYDRAFT_260579 [Fragilariopsis cylindrus CCMP1102]|eukprot:OEU18844.1 hypothetical protein FRACYDRAFT_260579 [Fragilariopsis cylindrus CCMP1102]
MSSRIMSYNINKNERQQQQQQLPTTNAYNLPKDVSKLDLHGYNKSEGIRRTTDFLDRIASKSKQNSTKAWALVVTGSGAHSSHSQGPVLRGAIENLLIKRNIEYYPMKGNGSFLVNALSGFVLYEPEQPRDTKVIISANANNAKNNHPSASYSSAVASMAAIKPLSLKQQIDNTNNGVALKKAYNKQRKEELAYQRAMSQSLADPTYRAEKQEEESLERAFNLSILEKRRELQEEQKIQKIIEDSRRESRIQAMAELDEIQKVAELSIREFEQAMADEEDEIQKVAESSKREFDNNDNNAHNNNHNNNMRGSRKEAMMAEEEDDDDDDDDEVQKVVELSKIGFDNDNAPNNGNNNSDDMNDPDAYMLRAIELSRKVTNRVDDEMLSVLEQSILEHQRYQEDDEELLLKALEQSVAEF